MMSESRCIALILLVLGLFPQFSNAQTIAPFKKMENARKNDFTEQLMVSHLPHTMRSHLKINSEFTYVTDHEFYDTPVVLVDKDGKKITFKHQLDPSQHYSIDFIGERKLVESYIWFFSPKGAELPEEKFDLSYCTAQRPCKQINQNFVEYINQNSFGGKLWFATGVYELPQAAGGDIYQKLLELRHRQEVIGRTADFRNIPEDHERPLLIGTLSWNDFYEHTGAEGRLMHIKIKNENNQPNLISSGNLEVHWCDLNKIGQGANIISDTLGLYDSTLNIVSANDIGYNVYTISGAMISNSSLNAEIFGGQNIAFYNDYGGGGLLIENSKLFVKSSSKEHVCVSAIDAVTAEPGLLSIEGSELKIVSKSHMKSICPVSAIGSISVAIYIKNSLVDAFTENDEIEAIYSRDAPVHLDTSTIHIESSNNKVNAIQINQEIVFQGKASTISLISPISTSFFSAFGTEDFAILNKSSPQSICSSNNGPFIPCQADIIS